MPWYGAKIQLHLADNVWLVMDDQKQAIIQELSRQVQILLSNHLLSYHCFILIWLCLIFSCAISHALINICLQPDTSSKILISVFSPRHFSFRIFKGSLTVCLKTSSKGLKEILERLPWWSLNTLQYIIFYKIANRILFCLLNRGWLWTKVQALDLPSVHK